MESDLDTPGREPEFEANQQEAEFLGRDDDEMVATESTNPEVAVASLESEPDPDSDDPDASASHNIDPLPPHNFRLFGFGKKKEGEPAPEEKSGTVAAISTYAPGAGHIEEEVIEGEEFDVAHSRQRKPRSPTTSTSTKRKPSPLRSVPANSARMLQEAHLDPQIQLNFDDKSVEDESFDEDEEEEGATADAAPGDASGQPRRDRGQRGRGRVEGRSSSSVASKAIAAGWPPRAAPCRPAICQSSATCSSPARKF